MSVKAVRIVFICSTLGVLLVGFQNCGGKSSVFKNVSSSNFFSYPYASSPTYYSDVAVFQSADDTSKKLLQFQIITAARNVADPTASTKYHIQVVGPDNTVLCPDQSGILVPPVTTVAFDCVSAHPSTSMTVTLTLGTGASQQVVTKPFSL